MEKVALSAHEVSKVLKLLGDNTRLKIMQYVFEQECCVCELVELLNMSQPSISQHLRKLRDAQLVQERRKGNWVFYKVNVENRAYNLIENIIRELPSIKDNLEDLDRQNLRIICD
ncbi:metalloregulator ArsR/SmtB family transcription factor [Alkalibacillus silvisoli]|uniref:Metal-responsive transcriptional regulator AseR n=1 Tax=Alkalibacillus silvisoli TaxID=392823 RepID=A0ABN0ZLS3_9BACI